MRQRSILLRRIVIRSRTEAQESAPLPYAISKSAMRRRKRQARAALAGEGVSALEEALDTIDEPEEPISETVERATKVEAVKKEAKITATKRAKYLCALSALVDVHRALTLLSSDESKRLPAILKDASFRKDPFAAIRLHAQNTVRQSSYVHDPIAEPRRPARPANTAKEAARAEAARTY